MQLSLACSIGHRCNMLGGLAGVGWLDGAGTRVQDWPGWVERAWPLQGHPSCFGATQLPGSCGSWGFDHRRMCAAVTAAYSILALAGSAPARSSLWDGPESVPVAR